MTLESLKAETESKTLVMNFSTGSRSSVNTSTINTGTSVVSTIFKGIIVASTLGTKVPSNVNTNIK